MTDRGDPKAIFDVVYGCSPTGKLQKELKFKARDITPGGHICVRSASGDRTEFRYSPPGNTGELISLPYERSLMCLPATARLCIKVTLAIV